MIDYPPNPVGGFPSPPRSIVDEESRNIRLRRLRADDSLVEMYAGFLPEDRAQGIPPASESAIRSWLKTIRTSECLNLVAVDATPVGHATLVPDEDGGFELAIFVCRDHQHAGIGTALLRTTLGAAGQAGIDRIWLTVERWNDPALALYERVGFEPVETEQFERTMSLRLSDSADTA
jgi:Acetyltransferases